MVDARCRLCAAATRSLPSRFLFAVDDGRGDVSGALLILVIGLLIMIMDGSWLAVRAWAFRSRWTDAVDCCSILRTSSCAASQGSGAWHVRDFASWATGIPGVRAITLPQR